MMRSAPLSDAVVGIYRLMRSELFLRWSEEQLLDEVRRIIVIFAELLIKPGTSRNIGEHDGNGGGLGRVHSRFTRLHANADDINACANNG